MLKALSTSETWTFESEHDPDKGTPNATRFTLGVLDVFIRARIFDGSTTINEEGLLSLKHTQMNLESVKFGLRGWENFKDEKGNDIPFETVTQIVNGRKYEVVTDECLGRLNLPVISEIGQAIRDGNSLAEDVVKNSEAG